MEKGKITSYFRKTSTIAQINVGTKKEANNINVQKKRKISSFANVESDTDYDSDSTIIYDYEQEISFDSIKHDENDENLSQLKQATRTSTRIKEKLTKFLNTNENNVDTNLQVKHTTSNKCKRIKTKLLDTSNELNVQANNKRSSTKKPSKRTQKKSKEKTKKIILIDDSPTKTGNNAEPLLPIAKPEVLKLWTEKYQAQTSSDIVDNLEQVNSFKNWLSSWEENFGSKNDFDMNDDEIVSNFIDGKCMYIYGPTGTGKTSLVYSIAKEFGYKVLEYNATSQRLTASLIQKEINESLQSYYINKNKMNFFFNKNNLKSEKESKNSNVQLSKSLILVDDIDATIYENNSFVEIWRALRSILFDARKPVVITSKIEAFFLCNELNCFNVLRLDPIKYSSMSNHMNTIFQNENVSLAVDNEKQRPKFNGDLRKIINQSQFWGLDSLSVPSTQNVAKDDDKEANRSLLSLYELLSLQDIYNVQLDTCWNVGIEQENTYNRYLYDDRLILVDVNQHDASNVDRLCLDRVSNQFHRYSDDDESEELNTLTHFISAHFIDDTFTRPPSFYLDYVPFFELILDRYPNLITDMESMKNPNITLTRAKRNSLKKNLPLYL